jgi:hypothetical protein
MSSHKTKDERFILCAYEAGIHANDMDVIMNRYEIGRRAGITEKGVNAICNLLAQANFIKKLGDTEIRLTKNGQELAQRLLSE